MVRRTDSIARWTCTGSPEAFVATSGAWARSDWSTISTSQIASNAMSTSSRLRLADGMTLTVATGHDLIRPDRSSTPSLWTSSEMCLRTVTGAMVSRSAIAAVV